MNTFFCYKIWIWAIFVLNYYIVFGYIYFEICVTTFNNLFLKLVLHKFWIIIPYRIMIHLWNVDIVIFSKISI
jgi:hypothetical protein